MRAAGIPARIAPATLTDEEISAALANAFPLAADRMAPLVTSDEVIATIRSGAVADLLGSEVAEALDTLTDEAISAALFASPVDDPDLRTMVAEHAIVEWFDGETWVIADPAHGVATAASGPPVAEPTEDQQHTVSVALHVERLDRKSVV